MITLQCEASGGEWQDICERLPRFRDICQRLPRLKIVPGFLLTLVNKINAQSSQMIHTGQLQGQSISEISVTVRNIFVLSPP